MRVKKRVDEPNKFNDPNFSAYYKQPKIIMNKKKQKKFTHAALRLGDEEKEFLFVVVFFPF